VTLSVHECLVHDRSRRTITLHVLDPFFSRVHRAIVFASADVLLIVGPENEIRLAGQRSSPVVVDIIRRIPLANTDGVFAVRLAVIAFACGENNLVILAFQAKPEFSFGIPENFITWVAHSYLLLAFRRVWVRAVCIPFPELSLTIVNE
jgi:hypothetical protein